MSFTKVPDVLGLSKWLLFAARNSFDLSRNLSPAKMNFGLSTRDYENFTIHSVWGHPNFQAKMSRFSPLWRQLRRSKTGGFQTHSSDDGIIEAHLSPGIPSVAWDIESGVGAGTSKFSSKTPLISLSRRYRKPTVLASLPLAAGAIIQSAGLHRTSEVIQKGSTDTWDVSVLLKNKARPPSWMTTRRTFQPVGPMSADGARMMRTLHDVWSGGAKGTDQIRSSEGRRHNIRSFAPVETRLTAIRGAQSMETGRQILPEQGRAGFFSVGEGRQESHAMSFGSAKSALTASVDFGSEQRKGAWQGENIPASAQQNFSDALGEFFFRQARLPPSGGSAFDPRLTPAWAGLTQAL
jgi:hypothetical protein